MQKIKLTESRDAKNSRINDCARKNGLPMLNIKAEGLVQSKTVLVRTKHDSITTGVYYHDLCEWHIDHHFRNHDYVVEWWPIPDFETGTKPCAK